MSSNVLKTTLVNTAISDPTLAEVGAAALALAIEGLLLERDTLKPNPDMAYVKADVHGFIVVDVDADALTAAYHLFPEANVGEDIVDELESTYTTETFRIPTGVKSVDQLQGDVWRRWNPELLTWDDV